MKKIILTVLALVILSSVAFAEEPWYKQAGDFTEDLEEFVGDYEFAGARNYVPEEDTGSKDISYEASESVEIDNTSMMTVLQGAKKQVR